MDDVFQNHRLVGFLDYSSGYRDMKTQQYNEYYQQSKRNLVAEYTIRQINITMNRKNNL
jgi:hypothetical protein